MRGKLADRDAVCPYLICHTDQIIACEGPIPDSRVHIIMPKDKKREQYKNYCCGKWTCCEIARANEWKYDEQ